MKQSKQRAYIQPTRKRNLKNRSPCNQRETLPTGRLFVFGNLLGRSQYPRQIALQERVEDLTRQNVALVWDRPYAWLVLFELSSLV